MTALIEPCDHHPMYDVATAPCSRRSIGRPARVTRALVVAGWFAVASLLATAAPASAATVRVTRGEAQAVLQTFGGAGRTVRAHSPVQVGAPADAELRATIRPLASEGFDGRHYCAEDWHVITLLVFNGGDRTFTREDAGLDQVVLTFSLDDNLLPTTRTAVKRVGDTTGLPPELGIEVAYWFQQGRLMSPSDLGVGAHDLLVHVVFPDETFDLQITFHIDAPGTGACI